MPLYYDVYDGNRNDAEELPEILKRLIKTEVSEFSDGIPRLTYEVDAEAFQALSETCLGKTILITNRKDWDEASIITAYFSQFIIEGVFKEMKDRQTGSWWALHHWRDSKIRVHALYCTIALLLRALALRRVSRAGLTLSMPRFLAELDTIREVINVYPKKRGKKTARRQTVLTEDLGATRPDPGGFGAQQRKI